ncbi:phosphatase PAP2 family protein [Adlercreutzia equolifaciens]|uniref:phosphatase PAP2 family protein n=1 Tax=Adlercreutzia equolifaciens TaxID=446660 RepID=UPI0023AE91FF|nr:phosphatase PAP2 family protein [Adlercreutzia equolifaciens]MDE8701597.1 phosphatase PAP2 family protein [Adlercreutzia equolifaciens]
MAQGSRTSSYARRYERWAAPLRGREGIVRGLGLANRVIVWVFYLAYALLVGLILPGTFGDEGLSTVAAVPGFKALAFWDTPLRCLSLAGAVVVIPALGFVLLSLVRAKLDVPRPAEGAGIEPLVPRPGTGRSFPSRHAFSAFAIAASWWVASPTVAVVLLVFAGLLAVLRVVAGVHYPRDVVVGAAIGVATGALVVAMAELLKMMM